MIRFIVLLDGRTLNGLITSKNEKTLTIQTQTDRLTIQIDEIDELKATTKSPMPDGLLDALSEKQLHNLLQYLQQPSQVRLPSGTVPHDRRVP